MIKILVKVAIFMAIFALTGTVLFIQAQSEVKAEYASRRAGEPRMIALYNLASGLEEDCPAPFEYKGSIIQTRYDEEFGTRIIGFTIADRNNRRTYFNIDEDLYNEIKLPLVDMDWLNTLITKGRQVGVLAYGCGASGRMLMAQNVVDLAFIKSPTISKNSSRQESISSKVQKQQTSIAKINLQSSESVVWLRNKNNPVRPYGQKWLEDSYYGIENFKRVDIGVGQGTDIDNNKRHNPSSDCQPSYNNPCQRYGDPNDPESSNWEPYYNKPSNCRTPNYSPELSYQLKPYRPDDARIYHQPRALYTEKAWNAKTEGSVKLKFVLLADGTVGQIEPLNRLPNGLTESALRAACYITFRPATNETLQPIDSIQILTYQFTLSQAYSPIEYSYPRKKQSIQNNQPKPGEIIPLRILSKPRAPFTDEARVNGTMGVVTLQIIFLASGKIGLISVVKGLPNGLTQEAIKAAQNIKFEPQTKGGIPYTVLKQIKYYFTLY